LPCTAEPRFISEDGVMPDPKNCLAVFLGSVDYESALGLQMHICELKKRGFAEDVLLLLEHPPTITLGRNGKWHHLLAADEALAARGVRTFEVDRGGDITFHGPGQLVGYPLIKLELGERDVHRYMANLEESLISLLASFGIQTGREKKLTGVWTEKGKIGAMGVHISRWITRHGFALNVNTDLSFFDLIVPCGIQGKGVVSMQSLLSRPFDLADVAARYLPEFGRCMARMMTPVSEPELMRRLQEHDPKATVA
jgi:lipoyl(octanoyl) transferase